MVSCERNWAFDEKAVWGQFSGLPTLTFHSGQGPNGSEFVHPPLGVSFRDGLPSDGSHLDADLRTEEIMDNAKTRGLLGASFCSMLEDHNDDAAFNVEKDMLFYGDDSLFGEPVIGVPQTKLVKPGFAEKVFSSQSHDASSTTDTSQTSASSDVEQDSSSICAGYLGLDQATHETITAVASHLFTSSEFDTDSDFLPAQRPRRQVTLPEPEPAPSTPNSEERKVITCPDGFLPVDQNEERHATKCRTKLRSEAKEFTPGAFDGLWQENDGQADWTWSEHNANHGNGGYPTGANFEADMLAAASFGVQVASAVAHLSHLQAGQKSKLDEEIDLPKSMTPKLNAAVSRREQAAIANVVQQNVQALKMRNQISQPSSKSHAFAGNDLQRQSYAGGEDSKARVMRRFCHLCGKSVQPFFKFCASCGGNIEV